MSEHESIMKAAETSPASGVYEVTGAYVGKYAAASRPEYAVKAQQSSNGEPRESVSSQRDERPG